MNQKIAATLAMRYGTHDQPGRQEHRQLARPHFAGVLSAFGGLLVWRYDQKRSVCLLMMALVMACGTPGCLVSRGMLAFRHRDPMQGAPRLKNSRNPRVEEVIAHLNENTDRVHGWRANRVEMYHKFPLQGSIAVEKGGHLRLEVTSMRGKEADVGSNNERFWVWARELEPSFITCKHENMEIARQQVGIPFEPHWLMQVLGVERLPTTGVTMQTDPGNEQVRLVEHLVSAHGQQLRRFVIVDLKKGGIVVEHGLYNYDSVPIALAKLSDHRLDRESGVVLPNRITIELPQHKMSMVIKLNKIQVNPESIPSTFWEMPHIRDCQIVHLDGGVHRGGITTAVRPDIPEPTEGAGPIETIRSHDDHNFLRDDFGQEDENSPGDDSESSFSDENSPGDDSPGRATMSSPADDEASQDEFEDDWAK